MHLPELRIRTGGLILGFCPINQEVCQSLGLDRCVRLILDSMSCDFNGPLCHSARCISVAYDFCQWSRTDDCDRVSLKIGPQLLCCHVHTIAHLLIVGVVLLGGGEHFTDIVYRPLDQLCLVLFRTLDHHDNTDHPRGCCNIQHHWLFLNWCCQHRSGGQHMLEIFECFICLIGPHKLVRLLHQLVQRNCLLAEPTEESAERC